MQEEHAGDSAALESEGRVQANLSTNSTRSLFDDPCHLQAKSKKEWLSRGRKVANKWKTNIGRVLAIVGLDFQAAAAAADLCFPAGVCYSAARQPQESTALVCTRTYMRTPR